MYITTSSGTLPIERLMQRVKFLKSNSCSLGHLYSNICALSEHNADGRGSLEVYTVQGTISSRIIIRRTASYTVCHPLLTRWQDHSTLLRKCRPRLQQYFEGPILDFSHLTLDLFIHPDKTTPTSKVFMGTIDNFRTL